MVAQFTTAGTMSGQIQVQVFQNGDQEQEFRDSLPMCNTGECGGCTDASAVNFDEDAYYDDGSCEAATPGCTDAELATTTRMRRKTTVLAWILTSVVFAVALASQRVTATATATSLTSVECVAALASLKVLVTATATLKMSAVFVAVMALPKAHATATGTQKMPSVSVAANALQMRMPTAFVMTWTIALANTTSAAFATAQAL